MWIRMISTAAGPRLPHALIADRTYEVADELGQEMIDAKAAVRAADPSPAARKLQDTVAEVAAVDDGEKALDPDGEKKAKPLIERLKPAAKADAAKK